MSDIPDYILKKPKKPSIGELVGGLTDAKGTIYFDTRSLLHAGESIVPSSSGVTPVFPGNGTAIAPPINTTDPTVSSWGPDFLWKWRP